ncbi:MAG: hypothetical protein MZU95_13540 [Desulfomicrobium escambiense]|nr:hypothetical protein [Desulfomicrobium escambiense]
MSGAIGSAAAGAGRRSRPGARPRAGWRRARRRFLRPEPRVRLGVLLGRNRAASAVRRSERRPRPTACDSWRAPRGVGVEIDGEAAVPVRAARRRGSKTAKASIRSTRRSSGGDDYELLFTVRRAPAARASTAVLPPGARACPARASGRSRRTGDSC